MNIEEPNIVIPVNPEKPVFNMKSNTAIPQQKNQDPVVPLSMPKSSITKISSSQLKPWIENLKGSVSSVSLKAAPNPGTVVK